MQRKLDRHPRPGPPSGAAVVGLSRWSVHQSPPYVCVGDVTPTRIGSPSPFVFLLMASHFCFSLNPTYELMSLGEGTRQRRNTYMHADRCNTPARTHATTSARSMQSKSNRKKLKVRVQVGTQHNTTCVRTTRSSDD